MKLSSEAPLRNRDWLLRKNGGGERIFLSFAGEIENLSLAFELAGTGEIRLSTLIEGNTHFLHTDRESIELALRHASPRDRELYLRGQELAESGATPTEGADAEALAFYNDLHGSLVYASGGTDWEILKWEDILLRGGTPHRRCSEPPGCVHTRHRRNTSHH